MGPVEEGGDGGDGVDARAKAVLGSVRMWIMRVTRVSAPEGQLSSR